MRPTGARHFVVLLAVLLAMITYIDRVCISQATPNIQHDLGFTNSQMGLVFLAFQVAYALFEIPSGRMGDRSGPRNVLMKVVLLWSAFTAATGYAWNLGSMVVCRFIFGAGEAGCYPNLTKIFTIWLPSRERGRAQGILWLASRWGGAITPMLVVLVLMHVHWRSAFVLFGCLGVLWAIGFYLWFRDRPSEHPGVNAAELAMMDGAKTNAPRHEKVPWKTLLSSRSVLGLWLQYFCMSYGWYFYITWLPTYLIARGAGPTNLHWMDGLASLIGGSNPLLVDKIRAALLAGIPLFFGGIGCVAGSVLVNLMVGKNGNLRRARQVVSGVGLGIAGLMQYIVPQMHSSLTAMLALGIASFANDLAMASCWGACMDIGGSHAGSLSGSMNMIGNLGGALGPYVVGWILQLGGKTASGQPLNSSWNLAFFIAAAVYMVGAAAWIFIDPVTSLDKSQKHCGQCGAVQEPIARFCSGCGAPL